MDSIDGVQAAPPDELAALHLDQWPYGGNARPSQEWFDECARLGIPPRVMIYESYPTRSQAGFDHGVWDCRGHEQRVRERGFRGVNAVAVSDGNWADRWDASAHGAGWASAATMPYFGYGALGVLESWEAGAAGPLLIPGGWIPETWGQGRVASQLVYTKVAISTPHDLNRVYIDFGAPSPGPTPGPTPAPIPQPSQPKDDTMIVSDSDATAYVPNGVFALDANGIRYIGDPAELDAWTTAGHPVVPMGGGSINAIRRVPGTVGAPADPTLDVGALATQLGPLVHVPVVNVDAVVAAARKAVATSPKGVPATKKVIGDLVDTAIRGALQ